METKPCAACGALVHIECYDKGAKEIIIGAIIDGYVVCEKCFRKCVFRTNRGDWMLGRKPMKKRKQKRKPIVHHGKVVGWR